MKNNYICISHELLKNNKTTLLGDIGVENAVIRIIKSESTIYGDNQ